MSMSILPNTRFTTGQKGSALVVAMIVLAILGALGLAALDVADLNIFISANDRDSKESFFHADSGVNMGHEYLEESIESVNSTFYSSSYNGGNDTDATTWPPRGVDFDTSPSITTWYPDGIMATFVRAGSLDSGVLEGSAMQIGAGYEGVGKGAASGGTFTNYLLRSHREGKRNSVAEVDLGWKHINY